jgi:uncharacterized protein YutE (UPF0331/DUF86 family)
MSPQVISRKLAYLQSYLNDLQVLADHGEIKENHYASERLIQLIVETMFDIMSHWLTSKGFSSSDSYAEVVAEAGQRGMITPALADRLLPAARMRNLLVHMDERIDLEKLQQAVPSALEDAREFIRQVSTRTSP